MSTPTPTAFYTPTPTAYYPMEPTPTAGPTCPACAAQATCAPSFNEQLKNAAKWRDPWWGGIFVYVVPIMLIALIVYLVQRC